MPNPLLGFFNNSMSNTPLGNLSNLISQFNNFKNTFNGDPKQQVMNMLSSGQMSQEQFTQLQQMANQFRNILNN